jgi:uncharacterized protein (DUF1501 family)
MQPTRRDFLRLGLGTSTLLAYGTTVPAFLARSAAALPASAGAKGNVLIVLQLDGGNDGLNTVIPYADPEYQKSRPKLRVLKDQLHKIDDHIGLHGSLGGFDKLLHQHRLAVVQSVGYPNPNRSHFESMAIWHTAHLDAKADTPGWLARSIDVRPPAVGRDVAALHVSESLLPQALAGGQRQVPSLTSLEQFRRRLGMPNGPAADQQRAALDRIAAEPHGGADSLLQFVERSTVLTYTSSARLEGVLKGQTGGAGYPEGYGLAQRLRLIARLIQAGLSTSIYYTRLGSFDTHSGQQYTHANLLREMGDSLHAFLEDLNASGDGHRIVVLIFSEFGRRLRENASAGTDHGTAAPVFLLGPRVRPGVHGPYPNLRDLDDGGDPRHAIDFRRLYATVLDRWLGCPSEKVLAGKFAHLPVVQA